MSIQSSIIRRLEWDNLLIKRGRALDVGVGLGRETLALANLGFEVDSVDINIKYLDAIKDNIGIFKVNLINKDISSFEMLKNTYQVVILNNVLLFISDKEEVRRVINSITESIVNGGVLYLSTFGPKNEGFNGRATSFFEYNEILEVLEENKLTVYNKMMQEGYANDMAKNKKFWQIYTFICIK